MSVSTRLSTCPSACSTKGLFVHLFVPLLTSMCPVCVRTPVCPRFSQDCGGRVPEAGAPLSRGQPQPRNGHVAQ
eukprot:25986-Eustigmatos_ZCMA.PRE.1